MTRILDEFGRPLPSHAKQRALRTLRAKFDAAQTNDDNSRHWANADYLGPRSANSETVRKTLRSRARYEANESNSYAKGMCLTLAHDCIGTGPRLQLLTPNKKANAFIEGKVARWMNAVKLAQKLRLMRFSKAVAGEIFGLQINNDNLPTEVKLDVRLIEADQVATPDLIPMDENSIDGIRFDAAGNPTEYHVLRHHPGETDIGINIPTTDYDHVPADQVIHLFREDRPGQRRGIPEIAPALPLFAQLRRYTLAVLAAAETAADFAAVMYTDSPSITDVDDVEALDAFELEKRAMLTLPQGWKMGQVKAEQPTTTYGEFKKEILGEIARVLNMPYNVAAGNSADYNYASGRLDHQTYFKAIRIEQHFFEVMCLNRIFEWWFDEAALVPGLIPDGMGPFSEWNYQWFWDAHEHVDPEKEANATKVLYDAGLLTKASYHGRGGNDWEKVDEQRARELGVSTEELRKLEREKLYPPTPEIQSPTQKTNTRQKIAASGEPDLILAAPDAWKIEAAADSATSPKASILAYGGGMMHVPKVGPVVVDLAGLDLSAGQIPLLVDHKNDLEGVVGQGTPEIRDGAVYVAGSIHAVNAASQQVLTLHRSGFRFQASVGLTALETTRIRPGQTIRVNGRTITAPGSGFTLVKRSKLREVSLTPAGADNQTAVSIAASHIGDPSMDPKFKAWLEARGHKPDEMAEDILAMLQTTWEADVKLEGKRETDLRATLEAEIKAKADAANGDPDPVAELRASALAETQRIAGIQGVCGGQHTEIQAKAIEGGWDTNRTELEILRESRAKGPAIHSGTPKASPQVLEASVRLMGGEREDALVEEYGEQTIEAADRGGYRRLTLHGLFDLCCRMEGKPYPGMTASDNEIINAAFSTASLSGILGDSARKSMQASYQAVESVVPIVAKKLSVNDFKTHTGYRLTAPSMMEEVGPGGEIKHMTVDEESYTYKALTYAKMFGVTRTMLINDDMGAFTEIPRLIGRGAALALENSFWTLVLANTGSFFGTGNSNYISGAATNLQSSSLKTATTSFRKLTDADGYPIAVSPRYLLVPPDIEVDAAELYVSTNINTGGSSTTEKVPNKNIWASKYQPLVSPYLSNSSYSGYSTTAWYLLANPADVACFGVCYLRGAERPVVEDAPLASNILGQAWRGYFDFGVCQVDKRGGVMSKGAA